MNKNDVPDIVVGRLPRYLSTLKRMQIEGISTTSSKELADRLGITAAQIRKDFSEFGGFGKQGTGYTVSYLISQLEGILNVNRIWDTIIVGAGDLGHALARYGGFVNRGFRVRMIFDCDPAKVGKKICEITIQDVATLSRVLPASGIKIAMLCVPASGAQKVADNLVASGIRAILNYTPAVLNLPEGVLVQSIDPILKLQHMAFYLD